jgi:hypothetical protein
MSKILFIKTIFSLCVILFLHINVQAQAKSNVPERFTIGIGHQLGWVTRTPYTDVGITEVKILSFRLNPIIYTRVHKDWSLGMVFNYIEGRDLIADTLFPVGRGIGVTARRSLRISKKRAIFWAFEPQVLINNFSPESKSKSEVDSKRLVHPQLIFNVLVQIRVYKQLYAGLTFSKSYFVSTNKLYFIRPYARIISLEYKFCKNDQ